MIIFGVKNNRNFNEKWGKFMKKRPGFLSLLAIMSILSGLAILCMEVWVTVNRIDPSSALGVSPILLNIVIGFMGIVALLSGVGMIKGRPWGWFAGVYYQIFNIGRNFLAFLYLFLSRGIYQAEGIDLGYQYAKFSVRILFSVMILYYFASEKLMDYFEIDQSKKKTHIIKLIGVGILTFIIRDSAGYFFSL